MRLVILIIISLSAFKFSINAQNKYDINQINDYIYLKQISKSGESKYIDTLYIAGQINLNLIYKDSCSLYIVTCHQVVFSFLKNDISITKYSYCSNGFKKEDSFEFLISKEVMVGLIDYAINEDLLCFTLEDENNKFSICKKICLIDDEFVKTVYSILNILESHTINHSIE